MTFESAHNLGDRVMVYPPYAESYLATVDGVRFTPGKVNYLITSWTGSAWVDAAFIQPVTPTEAPPSASTPDLEPMEVWARRNNLIMAPGGALAFVLALDGEHRLFMVPPAIPFVVPPGVHAERWLREKVLHNATEERARIRALGWTDPAQEEP